MATTPVASARRLEFHLAISHLLKDYVVLIPYVGKRQVLLKLPAIRLAR